MAASIAPLLRTKILMLAMTQDKEADNVSNDHKCNMHA